MRGLFSAVSRRSRLRSRSAAAQRGLKDIDADTHRDGHNQKNGGRPCVLAVYRHLREQHATWMHAGTAIQNNSWPGTLQTVKIGRHLSTIWPPLHAYPSKFEILKGSAELS